MSVRAFFLACGGGAFGFALLAGALAGDLSPLLGTAKTIVAAEITSIDTSRMPADGPMHAEAKALKVIRGGSLRAGRSFTFQASAWLGPTYADGERRILLLDESDPPSALDPGKADLFFADEAALERLSEHALAALLRDTAAPAVTCTAAPERMIRIRLTNTGESPFRLSPQRVMASFDARDVRYDRAIRWTEVQGGPPPEWVDLAPGSTLSAAVSVDPAEVAPGDEIAFTLVHWAVCFPHRGWIGVHTTRLRLPR